MATYVDPWNLQAPLAPIRCGGARMYGFALRADHEALEALAGRWLSGPCHGELDYFAPDLVGWVFVTFSHIARLQPVASPYSDLGWMDETEVAFWAFLPRRVGHPLRFRPIFHVPHIFVDRGDAMIQGRERYGFPKQLASFHYGEERTFPRGDLEPERIAATAFGVRHFDRDAEWKPYDLVTLERATARERPSLAIHPDWTRHRDLGAAVRNRLGQDPLDIALTAMMQAMNGMLPPEGRVAFLKQLPSGGPGIGADYQAVIEAEIEVERMHRGGLLDSDYRIRIARSDTHPIVRDLGLVPISDEEDEVFRPHLGWWADMDFTLGPSETMWKAPDAVSVAVPESVPAEARDPGTKRRVAVLGGGLGGITAAYWLTHPDNPEAGRIEVTVYQKGARLGGKCASARDQTRHERVEEHGLHVWFGFYYNAVRMMRDCFAERAGGAEPGRRLFEENFLPHHAIVLGERVAGTWKPLSMPFPPRLEGDGELDAQEFVDELVAWMLAAIAELPLVSSLAESRAAGALSQVVTPVAHALVSAWKWQAQWRRRPIIESSAEPTSTLAQRREEIHDDVSRLMTTWPGLLRSVVSALGDAVFSVDRNALGQALGRLRRGLRPGPEADDRLRRAWLAADLAIATLRGVFADNVPEQGFDQLDRWTLAEWLGRHGADAETIASPWIRSMYGIVFAFPGGDTANPDIGAGTVLRSALRMLFAYRESFLWKMKAGMGDAVFTPLYEVLASRGVRFEFFHRVRSVEVDGSGRFVGRVLLGRQANLAEENTSFHPLVRIGERNCWPRRPDLAQLRESDAAAYREAEDVPGLDGMHLYESAWSPLHPGLETKVILERGRDFDDVVLAIPPSAARSACADLIRSSERWAKMVDTVKTVRTQAFQLWMKPDLVALTGHPSWRHAISTAWELPIDSWGDFSPLIDAERWPEGKRPGALLYCCGVMEDDPDEPSPFTDPVYPSTQRSKVFARMRDTVLQKAPLWWPGAVVDGRFDWNLLVDPDDDGVRGEDLLARQFWTANIDPTERYVLSVKGSLYARLRPEAGQAEGRSGFDNLYLAGDWTRNGLNAGFVESAVVSGMQAARAISGWTDLLIEGETDFGKPRARRRER